MPPGPPEQLCGQNGRWAWGEISSRPHLSPPIGAGPAPVELPYKGENGEGTLSPNFSTAPRSTFRYSLESSHWAPGTPFYFCGHCYPSWAGEVTWESGELVLQVLLTKGKGGWSRVGRKPRSAIFLLALFPVGGCGGQEKTWTSMGGNRRRI